MKLVGPFVALVASATAQNGIKVTCNDDNTIDVNISYDRKADIIAFNYGTCNETSIRAQQDPSHNWKINLDVHRCGMDNKLRTIAYNQTVTARVGRGDLAFADFQADSWCEYTAEYTVKFNYGTLSTEAHAFSATGGLIDLDFSIASYESTFENKTNAPTQGGDTIHLGLSVGNKNFDHADKLYAATHGKNFVPRSCAVNDTENNLQYTLFDTADACTNTDVDLVVGHTGNMWTFSHTLFLLGNYKKSSFELSCAVLVCDAARSTKCDAVVNKCFGVDGKWSNYTAWTKCDKDCGTGSQNNSRTCTNPAPQFGGAKCSGNAEESQDCNTKSCPTNIHTCDCLSWDRRLKRMSENGYQNVTTDDNGWPSGTFSFSVQAKSDVHIFLRAAQGEISHWNSGTGIEIVIGGWGNYGNIIRDGMDGTTLMRESKSPAPMLSTSAMRPGEISWESQGSLMVSFNGRVIFELPNWESYVTPLKLTGIYIGTGYGASGEWITQYDVSG